MIRTLIVTSALIVSTLASVDLWREYSYSRLDAKSVVELLRNNELIGPGVVIIAQAKDCTSSPETFLRWVGSDSARGFSTVVLVVENDSSSRSVDLLFGASDRPDRIGTISARDAAIVAERLGFAATPFAVVIDTDSRVAGAYPAKTPIAADLLQRVIYPASNRQAALVRDTPQFPH